jgi:hypothetical protein
VKTAGEYEMTFQKRIGGAEVIKYRFRVRSFDHRSFFAFAAACFERRDAPRGEPFPAPSIVVFAV